MSILVERSGGGARCEADNASCTKEHTLQVHVGEMVSIALCVSCAREMFNALGFVICSQTGESIERLVGLKKRKGDR